MVACVCFFVRLFARLNLTICHASIWDMDRSHRIHSTPWTPSRKPALEFDQKCDNPVNQVGVHRLPPVAMFQAAIFDMKRTNDCGRNRCSMLLRLMFPSAGSSCFLKWLSIDLLCSDLVVSRGPRNTVGNDWQTLVSLFVRDSWHPYHHDSSRLIPLAHETSFAFDLIVTLP